jgi:hypothetical protein
VFALFLFASRTQGSITEGGILAHGWFYPWDKVKKVCWSKAAPPALKLSTWSRLPTAKTIYLRVPYDKTAEVDDAVRKVVPEKIRIIE